MAMRYNLGDAFSYFDENVLDDPMFFNTLKQKAPDITFPNFNFQPTIINEEADTFDEFVRQDNERKGILDLISNLGSQAKNFATDPRFRTPRTILATMAGGPVAGIASLLGGNLLDAFKNFQDKRKGRLDITADFGIMAAPEQPGGSADDNFPDGGGGRSSAAESFASEQSYGGGGNLGDLGADTFI